MATTKSKNLTGEKYYKKLKDKDLKVSNELYDNQVKSINRDYDTQVFEQGKAYEDQYRENAVQKEINKRQTGKDHGIPPNTIELPENKNRPDGRTVCRSRICFVHTVFTPLKPAGE